MNILLTRKLAHTLNGLDLRPFAVGEVIELDDSIAHMLIAEGWAEALPQFGQQTSIPDDRPRRRKGDGSQRR